MSESNSRAKPRKSKPWREDILTKVTDLSALTKWFAAQDSRATAPGTTYLNAALDDGILEHLQKAREAAEGTAKISRWYSDAPAMERAVSRTDAAEELILRRAPWSYVKGRLPEIHSDVMKYLDANDPRRLRLEQELNPHPCDPQTADDGSSRDSLVDATAAAHSRARQEYARVRSFHRVLLVTAVILMIMAASLAVLGGIFPREFSPCFNPQGTAQEPSKIVCAVHETQFPPSAGVPDGTDIDEAIHATARFYDVGLVELLGLVAAAVSGASSLRNIRGTSTPFALPVALALVKLPAGALTAYLGLVLMRGGFVPGLSALDTAPQILAWAVIFGASQQLFTGVVDRQAKSVLDKVGGKPHSAKA
ncbi:hypothetical protein [Arthrobacter sp. D1-17]